MKLALCHIGSANIIWGVKIGHQYHTGIKPKQAGWNGCVWSYDPEIS